MRRTLSSHLFIFCHVAGFFFSGVSPEARETERSEKRGGKKPERKFALRIVCDDGATSSRTTVVVHA